MRASGVTETNSARQAFEPLRDQGVIRYTGVTSHSAKLLADALEDYPYDCALITLNAARAVMEDVDHPDRFFRLAREKNVGVIAMKVFARGDLVKQGFSAEQLLRHVWGYPIATAVAGITEVSHLEENVRIARASGQLAEAKEFGTRTKAAG